MTQYPTTRKFPATVSIEDLIPRWCRSVSVRHHDDGTCTATAHRSEIEYVRRAIRIARAFASQ